MAERGMAGVVAPGAWPRRFLSEGQVGQRKKKWTFCVRRGLVRLFRAPEEGIGRSRPGLRRPMYRHASIRVCGVIVGAGRQAGRSYAGQLLSRPRDRAMLFVTVPTNRA